MQVGGSELAFGVNRNCTVTVSSFHLFINLSCAITFVPALWILKSEIWTVKIGSGD